MSKIMGTKGAGAAVDRRAKNCVPYIRRDAGGDNPLDTETTSEHLAVAAAGELDTAFTHYIAIGPFCWGRAKSIRAAVARMHEQSYYERTDDYAYVIVAAHSSSWVNDRGEVETPAGRPRSKLVKRVQTAVSHADRSLRPRGQEATRGSAAD